MKAKKAVKRLGKVETLLSNVIDQYAKSVDNVRELLDSAKASVVQAMEAVSVQSSTVAPKKPPVKAREPKRRGLSAEGRKKLSIAAKKRWAIAKRKGVSAVTGRPLSKTA
jgi:hypothetical protein